MSTVLDVAICLLLIGVAVGTLAVAVPDDDWRSTVDGDPAAASVGAVTATVPVANDHDAHGTLAQHLARASVLAATLDGERLLESTYPGATRRAVERRTTGRVRITARWRPYPDAALAGGLTVGPKPPSTADVAATRLSVDSGMAVPEGVDSTESLATAVADAYIDRLFPPERTRIRLVDRRVASRTADRYRSLAAVLGVDVAEPLADASPKQANERLASELADRLEAGMESGSDTAGPVPDGTATADVEIVVRRWEP
ncbi:uncharacterized protein Nmlp_1898 [Natronomonas moolapensis 8.8.11]|uniref:Uncharacterized protein n=1 Tax=Natronomonas moolapensis (strain DSM 18674 / CECT 7526 / JCM 14361 / 8.8.11) TaxID=268739 RepID=M1XPX7_NATM8|nr:uncharacterized protein Nmlp_1898 [Natronomonas moolapensis 8.8.11]